MTVNHPPIGATVLGYPRIGRQRELKRALEAFWAGRIPGPELDDMARATRAAALEAMSGLDTVPVNTFSWYDQVLDTAVMVGAVPERFAAVSGTHELAGFDADRYFAMARGTDAVPPLEMTKWFDTNYHYLVPEIDPGTVFSLHADKPLAEYAEAVDRGLAARPVVVGPYTFLALAKSASDAPDGFDPLSRLHDLAAVYEDLFETLAAAGVDWVQVDEPALVRDPQPGHLELARSCYERLAGATARPAILVATYFADPVEALPVLAASGVEGLALDLVRGPAVDSVRGLPGIQDKRLVLGAVDGRNIWRTDLRRALAELRQWDGIGLTRSVSTSCSLLHVPHDVELEQGLSVELRSILAFADQKLVEVTSLAAALTDGEAAAAEAFAASDAAVNGRAGVPGLSRPHIVARSAAVEESDMVRAPQAERHRAQVDRLGLPQLPTTTIGSFPQTDEIRRARAAHRGGRIDATTYAEEMREEVRRVVALQEDLGLDVLVHGEPERNDMVQYFAEQLDGFASTRHGWVQSYGSRCVRPPVLYGDVQRSRPMTVEWAEFAQSLTRKPVKGMLTGPVTMLAWSFVRDDQPRSTTAQQVALALRNEVTDLEAAGIGIIQVDEPALRETLPLRREEQAEYLRWAVDAFRLTTAGVRASTQIHTHLCYSEFGEIIDAIDALDADVTSIEAARSRMELLDAIARDSFSGGLGPGVYDIHSPRVPAVDEIAELLRAASSHLPAEALWVNPDCGLKTRAYDEVVPALRNLVLAAEQVRRELAG